MQSSESRLEGLKFHILVTLSESVNDPILKSSGYQSMLYSMLGNRP